MLSEELQKALDAAFVSARMEGHGLPTVEPPLLALHSKPHFFEGARTAGAVWRSLLNNKRPPFRDNGSSDACRQTPYPAQFLSQQSHPEKFLQRHVPG